MIRRMDANAHALPAPAGLASGLAAIPLKRKLMAAAGLAALTAILVASVLWSRQPEYRVLFTNLSDKDGGAVIAALSQMNVPYRFAPGGSAIMVPDDRVHDARLSLASQGLPRGGTVGFELLENQKFGVTQFQERLNFQRGLEGELSRSIQSLAAVQSARVHLALPVQNGFLREQQKPSASVLLALYPGRTLERAQIAGIVHLVASSVPDLAPKRVSIVDQSGTLLSASDEAAGPGLDATQLNYVRRIESVLAQRVLDIVEPIVGAGNVRAQVTADVDFTQSESTAEQFRPNQDGATASIRSQQVIESGAREAQAAGVPGALSNQPPQPATAPVNGPAQQTQAAATQTAASNGGGRREALTNYELDRTVRVTREASGTIRRLSAAIVVNHRRSIDADGKPTLVALSADEIESINALVREAIGFNRDRGDSINVVNAAFTETPAPELQEPALWQQPETMALARDLGKHALLVVLALIVILMLIRPALRSVARPAPPALSTRVDDPLQIPEPPAAGALPAPMLATEAPARTEMQEQILRLARADPAGVANVVRNWTGGEARDA